MIPYAKLAAAGIATLAIFYGCYRIYDAGRDSVQAKWDAEKAVQEAALAAATAETARIESEREKATKEIQDDLQAKLDATRNLNRDLANRLRSAFRDSGTVSEVPGGSRNPDGASGVGGDEGNPVNRIEQALNDHLAACDRDAIRLNGWIEWHNLMRSN